MENPTSLSFVSFVIGSGFDSEANWWSVSSLSFNTKIIPSLQCKLSQQTFILQRDLRSGSKLFSDSFFPSRYKTLKVLNSFDNIQAATWLSLVSHLATWKFLMTRNVVFEQFVNQFTVLSVKSVKFGDEKVKNRH